MSGRGYVAGMIAKAQQEGMRGTARRVVRKAYHRLGASALDFGLLHDDIADSTRLTQWPSVVRHGDRPLTIGWLTTPPAAGSGGHTTMFRMVEALERRGHRCVLVIYDRHHGSTAAQADVIRAAWPTVAAEVRSIDAGMSDLDACVATGWQTAHALARRQQHPMERFYFIQDYEPFFCGRGSEYELAADSYRFGFVNIALGHMVQRRLDSELGVDSEFVPFSCDTTTYSMTDTGDRRGVVFYAKPELPRRGYLLGTLALEEFHRRHPEEPIHIYGSPIGELSFPVTFHGRITPAQLNELYNQVAGGIAMSFTNISLVVEEMLAAGCIPVVNDSPDSRADLDNTHVAWALPTPGAIADELCRIVESPAIEARAAAAAASVRRDNWQTAAGMVCALIEGRLKGHDGGDDDVVRSD